VNEARFDHDPLTGESLGLLVEEARTNFALQSQSLDAGDSGSSTGWYVVVRSSISANIELSPDGTLTADKIIANTENNSHNLANRTQNNTIICANPCTVSVFLKASGETKAWLFITEASTYARTSLTYLDLTGSGSSTTPINANGAGSSSSSITAYPNGWYRCILTTTLGGTDSRVEVRIGPSQSMSTNIYTGNDSDGILAWGLQIERGSFPTSYIPTTASTATRTADNASMTGTNFSSWFNPNEGSISVVVSRPPSLEDTRYILSIDRGSFADGFFITKQLNSQSTARIRVDNGDTFVNVGDGVSWQGGISRRLVFGYSLASSRFVSQGNLTGGSNQTVTSFPDVNRLNIGSLVGTAFIINGTISQLTYFPKRLPNSNLQALTS
jgi:hypothetical protein